MNLRTILSPQGAAAFTVKVFVLIFCLLITTTLLSAELGAARMSFSGFVGTMLFFTALSVAAYFIRAGRVSHRPPNRVGARGAERTPLLPHMEDN